MQLPAHIFCGSLFISISASYLLISSDNLVLTCCALILLMIGNYILLRNSFSGKEIAYIQNEYLVILLIFSAVTVGILSWLNIKGIPFDYDDFNQFLVKDSDNPQIYLLCSLLLFVFIFLMSLAPLHFIFIESLSKVALPVVVYLLLIPEITCLAGYINMQIAIFKPLADKFAFLTQAIALISIGIGVLGACSAQNLRKIFAYIIVFHNGIVFLLIQNNSLQAITSALSYWIVVLFSLYGICCCFFAFKLKGEYLFMLNDFSGAAKKQPYISALLAFFIFTLAGIPPFPGFLSIFIVLNYLIRFNHTYQLAYLLIMLIISECVYLKIIKKIFFDKEQHTYDRTDFGINILITLLAAFMLIISIKPYLITEELPKILEQTIG